MKGERLGKGAVGAEHPALAGAEVVHYRLEGSVAVGAFLELGAVAGEVEEAKFKVAQDGVMVLCLCKLMQGFSQQLKELVAFHTFLGEGIDQLRDIEAAGHAVQVFFQGEKAVDGLSLGDDIKVFASGEQ